MENNQLYVFIPALRGEKLNTRNAERFTPRVAMMAEVGVQDEPGVTVPLNLK